MGYGARIKKLRVEAGLTQEEMANKTGCTRSAIASWETGKREPKFETLEMLASFFNVSADYLLGRDRQRILQNPLAAHYESQLPIDDDEELLKTIERMLERRRQKRAAKKDNEKK